MSKYMTKSKSTQMSEMQQSNKALHPGLVTVTTLTHEAISKRAYKMYVDNGCKEGKSEQNWLQADEEMKEWQIVNQP